MKVRQSRTTATPKNLAKVHAILEQKYHSPRHNNKCDPFNELIFIICSIQTTGKQSNLAYTQIRKAFPKHDDIYSASIEQLAEPFRYSGLGSQKAACLKQCAVLIYERFGKVTLSPLSNMSDPACESFLTSLPRVGLKVARCIMMYSLKREVFPVDTHCWRIGRRLGWVRNTTSDGQPRDREMNRFQKKIPPVFRYSLHVNLVAFGRDICMGQNPYCSECSLINQCRHIGVKARRE